MASTCVSARLSARSTAASSAATRKAAAVKPIAVAPKSASLRLSSARRAVRVGFSASKATPISRATNTRQTTKCSYEAGVGLYGQKAGMTTWFDEEGDAVACTIIALPDGNVVTNLKTQERDGYDAVQVGYNTVAEKKLTKAQLGHLNKANAPNLRHLGEFRLKDTSGFELGQQLNLEEIFNKGDLIDVRSRSIGKGFQGGIKRWGFKRGLMTHGSKSHRAHGSIGMSATPSRVLPGGKHPGRMGNKMVKQRKLKVLEVDAEMKAIVVKGSVPGKAGALVRITPAKIVGKNI